MMPELGGLALGYGAGALSTLSPCVLPLLPIILLGALEQHAWGPVALFARLQHRTRFDGAACRCRCPYRWHGRCSSRSGTSDGICACYRASRDWRPSVDRPSQAEWDRRPGLAGHAARSDLVTLLRPDARRSDRPRGSERNRRPGGDDHGVVQPWGRDADHGAGLRLEASDRYPTRLVGARIADRQARHGRDAYWRRRPRPYRLRQDRRIGPDTCHAGLAGYRDDAAVKPRRC